MPSVEVGMKALVFTPSPQSLKIKGENKRAISQAAAVMDS